MTEDVFGILGTTQCGSFHIERVVAEGGFSVVYKAQHGAFRAPVALKCLKVPGSMSAAENNAFLEKLREEAELLFRLSATIPEVVRPLHVDALDLKDRFVPFLALEWLEGEAFDEMLRRRHEQGHAPMRLHKLVKLLAPIARALSRAHRFPGPSGLVSVIHRDIKPENILIARVNEEETIKILDFGIAKAQTVADLRLGKAGDDDTKAAFTPAYGAPEQWSPRTLGPTGPWTDVWGLALTMAEALAGRPAIDGEIAEMRALALDPARRPTPRVLGATVSDQVESAFLHALLVNPKERTQSVEKFWSDLEAALGSESSLSRRGDDRRDPTSDRGAIEAASAPPQASGTAGRLGPDPAKEAALLRQIEALELSRSERPPPPQAVEPAPVSTPRPEATETASPRSPRHSADADGPLPVDDGALSAAIELDPRSGFGRPGRDDGQRISSPAFSRRASGSFQRPAPIAVAAPQGRDLRQVLDVPLKLIALGCLIGIADAIVSRALELGDAIALGPLRPLHLTLALVIGGTLLAFWRLFTDA